MLDFILTQIRDKHGVDPFSWEFIFDERYAGPRNGVVLGRRGRTTVLCILLRAMHRTQRRLVFPGIFDLGNRHGADGAAYTKKDLADELDQESCGGDSAVEPGSFRNIESWLLEMTGRPFREHLERNSLKALKVVKLLYRIQKDRQTSFLRLIRQVRPGRGSMEHRDRYPLFTKSHNERQVWLLADLRSYLGSELTIVQRHKIKKLLSSLLQRAEQRVNTTGMRLRIQHEHDPDAWCQAYKSTISGVQECGGVDSRPVVQDLDELIFVYVHALPFMHFAAEYEQIVEKTLPNASITPVGQEIERLMWVQCDADGRETESEYARISDARAVYERGWVEGVMPSILEKATGYLVDTDSYNLLTKRSVELLSRYFTYKKGIVNYSQLRVTLRSCVVAMCAVWLEMRNETEYRPYWMGQQAQGKRILGFLDQSFVQDSSAVAQPYPEVIDQIWAQRFEWMENAVQGRQEIGRLKALYKVAVLKQLASYVACLDIDRIAQLLGEQFPQVQFVTMNVGVSR